MIDDRLAESEEAILDATLGGSGKIAALQGRANEIQSILAAGTIGGKKLSRDDRVSLKNELISVNGQIEQEQDRITAENERHTDAMKAKIAKADQAFLDSLGGREAQLRNEQAIEQGRAGLAGDIRVSNELQRFFKESIKQARTTISEKKLATRRSPTCATSLTPRSRTSGRWRSRAGASGASGARSRSTSPSTSPSRTRNVNAERRARQAKIRFLVEQIETTRRGSVERKRLRAAIARERAELRDLNKEKEEDGSDSATTLADLFTKQVDINRGRSVGQPLLAPKIGDVTQPIEDRVQQQIRAQADVQVKSPFERTGDKVATSNDRLRESIERLTATIPNLTGVTGGPPPTQGEVVGARYDAMARFYQSRRGKQLAQENRQCLTFACSTTSARRSR